MEMGLNIADACVLCYCVFVSFTDLQVLCPICCSRNLVQQQSFLMCPNDACNLSLDSDGSSGTQLKILKEVSNPL